MVFQSKVDAWIVWVARGIPSVTLLAVVVAAASVHQLVNPRFLIIIAVFVLIGAFMNTTLRSTDYGIEGRELVIRSGLFRWRVPIAAITSVTPTRSPISSPALSLDRLRIEYGGRAILVSPLDKEGFIRALRAVNPAIRV